MELKFIIGCIIGWYFLSILLLFLTVKFSDSISGELEFGKFCDWIGGIFDDVTKFDDADPIVKTLLGCIGLPFFPVLLVGYMIFVILRAFFQVFLKIPWTICDKGLDGICRWIKN